MSCAGPPTLLLLAASLALMGCGDSADDFRPPGLATVDVTEAPDEGDSAPRGVGERRLPPASFGTDAGKTDAGGAAADVGSPDAGAPKAADVAPVDPCNGADRPSGCGCDDAGDCASGYCITVLSTPTCVEPCVEGCPTGFDCVPLDNGADRVHLCVPASTRLCQPCMTDDACRFGDDSDGWCVAYGDEGHFCADGCGDGGGCPEGYGCEEVASQGGARVHVCVRASGACECNFAGAALAMETLCVATNEFGRCGGSRRCSGEGLTACDAAAPAAEICDGVDNDCDGVVDEQDDGPPACLIQNDWGSCRGLLRCHDGADVCDGPAPAEEICNGADDDCDGRTDQGFPDTDDDGIADCVDEDDDNDGFLDGDDHCPLVPSATNEDLDGDGLGDACDPDVDGDGYGDGEDCAPRDPTIHPGALELCDGLDRDCSGAVDDRPRICDDGVGCTVDRCDAHGVGCVNEPPDGACDDGNPCTADTCRGGCVNEPLSGPTCDDGDVCSVDDRCVAGRCVSAPQLGCCRADTDCDDGNPCTVGVCDADTGACSHHAAPADGRPCNADDDGCTAGDACAAGRCEPGPAVVCAGGNPPCSVAVCRALNADDASCQVVAASAGTACDDGRVCTGGERCDGFGTCGRGVPLAGCCQVDDDCDDGNPCTANRCDPDSGICSAAPVEDGVACDADQDGCTVGDACAGGRCEAGGPAPCPAPSGPCLAVACEANGPSAFGCLEVAADEGGACDDGDACTVLDRCSGGECSGAERVCDDGNPCTLDACDATAGCLHAANTAMCDDGDACTTVDRCAGGACVGQGARLCDDGNPCTTDRCEPATGCVAPANALPCDDGDACTTGDACAQGRCAGGGATSCDDGVDCTLDACDPATGCSVTADDAGCDDGDPCTADACDAGAGCVHTFVCECRADGDCDDGNVCNGDERCTDGACQQGDALRSCVAQVLHFGFGVAVLGGLRPLR